MSSISFDQAYKKLNKAQKEAVDTIDGPVMVVAGPGTGKTQILTTRIGNILKKTDTNPENILAITFTDAGVAAMRNRLAELIGSRAYQVTISTFHSFCQSVITDNPEYFPNIIGSKPSNEVDQIALVEKIVDQLVGLHQISLLSPFGDRYFYVGDILSLIGELKREGVDQEFFAKLVLLEKKSFDSLEEKFHQKGPHTGKMKGEYQKLEKKIKKNEELSVVYKAYQEKLARQKIYDYSDMIMEVLKVLQKDNTLLLILQEKYQYFLVDEHQDTNNAQNKILELLASYHAPNPNLFIVGDDKQAIFRFQGASLENFYYFRTLYRTAKLVNLVENYRSTQDILDASSSLLKPETNLNSQKENNKNSSPLALCVFSEPKSEVYFVISQIKKLIDDGIAPSEIAILYRNNRDAFSFAELAKIMSVPYIIESDLDLLSEPDIKKILLVLKSLREHEHSPSLAYVLHLQIFGFEPLDVYKAIRKANSLQSRGNESRVGLWEVISDKKLLADAGVDDVEKFLNFSKLFSSLISRSHNLDLLAFLPEVLRDTGIIENILKGESSEDRLDTLNSFLDEARTLVESNPRATLDDFLDYIDVLNKHNIFIRKRQSNKIGKVRLMTVHRSKGLEFEYVFIVGCYAGHFGGRREIERLPLIDSVYRLGGKIVDFQSDSDSDDRRLLYVGITRAKKSVYISYSKQGPLGREQLPSPFLLEIDKNKIKEIDTKKYEEKAMKDKAIFLQPPSKNLSSKKADKDFVKDLFIKNGLSVSALNNYLSCPWKYFYRNLVRVPTAPEKYLSYGNAIHYALQKFFNSLKEEETSKKFLIDSFIYVIEREPINEKDFEEVLTRGKNSLSGWYETYKDNFNRNTLNEFMINGVLLSPEIRLTGKLDKLEFIDDGIVNVVDYKTGKPRTRNEIIGKTKNSNGDYYRQLVFYKLLLNNFNDGRYNMHSAMIDFIEPDEGGKYHREVFEIENDEVKDLEKLIHNVADEILTLAFWDKKCDDQECEFCHLRDTIG